MSMSSDSTLWKRSRPFFSLVGEINYASLSTIDLSIASTANDKRGEEIEIDYIQPSIPHHPETGHKALKKGGVRTY